MTSNEVTVKLKSCKTELVINYHPDIKKDPRMKLSAKVFIVSEDPFISSKPKTL